MRIALLAAATGAALATSATSSAAADVPAAPAVVVTAPADLPRIKLEKVVKLDKPIEVRHDPAGRLFAVEQTGRVLLMEDDKPAAGPAFLDLSDKVFVDFECGLLGLAFHPKFATNGLLYVNYTTKTGEGERRAGDKRKEQIRSYVSEFRVDPAGRRVDAGTERVLLTQDQPYVNHKGGQLQFGPDGMLYAGFGDGGSGHDPHSNGQNPNVWLGKILRIDVTPPTAAAQSEPAAKPGDAAPPAAAYTIPADNPFVGRPGWRPEIWALGLRNPWRFSFDRATGLLYTADVGQDIWEEVDVVAKGGNYGWRTREGAADLHPETPKAADTGPFLDPIYQYNHNKAAASITGGYVYRGKKIPALQGWYVFGDYSHGTLFGLKYDGKTVVASGTLVDPQVPGRDGGQRPTQPSGFGEDKDGELYMADVNGWVYRVVGG